jgi:hypothetical protein
VQWVGHLTCVTDDHGGEPGRLQDAAGRLLHLLDRDPRQRLLVLGQPLRRQARAGERGQRAGQPRVGGRGQRHAAQHVAAGAVQLAS